MWFWNSSKVLNSILHGLQVLFSLQSYCRCLRSSVKPNCMCDYLLIFSKLCGWLIDISSVSSPATSHCSSSWSQWSPQQWLSVYFERLRIIWPFLTDSRNSSGLSPQDGHPWRLKHAKLLPYARAWLTNLSSCSCNLTLHGMQITASHATHCLKSNGISLQTTHCKRDARLCSEFSEKFKWSGLKYSCIFLLISRSSWESERISIWRSVRVRKRQSLFILLFCRFAINIE